MTPFDKIFCVAYCLQLYCLCKVSKMCSFFLGTLDEKTTSRTKAHFLFSMLSLVLAILPVANGSVDLHPSNNGSHAQMEQSKLSFFTVFKNSFISQPGVSSQS